MSNLGPRAKKFSEFEVVRVGTQVIMRTTVDADKIGGVRIDVNIMLPDMEQAEMYEQWFQRLCDAAVVYEEVPDDVLRATIQLMKGK